METLESKKCGEGNVTIFGDKGDAENPMDREELKEPVKLENLKNYKKILAELSAGPVAGLTVIRVPVQEEKASLLNSQQHNIT